MPPKCRNPGNGAGSRGKPVQDIDNDIEELTYRIGNIAYEVIENETGVRTKNKRRRPKKENDSVKSLRRHEQYVEKRTNIGRETQIIDDLCDYGDIMPPGSNSPVYDDDVVQNISMDSDDFLPHGYDGFERNEVERTSAEQSEQKQSVDPVKLEPGVLMMGWEQTVFTEDHDTAAFRADNVGEQFDIKLFEKELSKLFSNVQIDQEKDEMDDFLLNEKHPHRNFKMVDPAGSDSLSYFRSVGLPEMVYQSEILKSIEKSDALKFLQDVCDSMPSDPNGECGADCICKPLSPKNESFGLMHFIVAAATPEFVKTITNKSVYDEYFSTYHPERPDLNHHYTNAIDAVLHKKSKHGPPISFAAELNRLDIVTTLLNCDRIDLYRKDTDLNKDGMSLIENLTYNDMLDKLNKEDLDKVLQATHFSRVISAYNLAAMKGDLKSMDFLRGVTPEIKANWKKHDNKIHPHALKSNQKYAVPGRYLSNGVRIYDNDKQEVTNAHRFASYGHFEHFKNMEAANKLQTDQYLWTALIPMLQFSDDEIKSELRTFRSAKREDQFMFLSQVIVMKRDALLDDSLQMIFANSENFSRVTENSVYYGSYGMPQDVALPMETALSRTGNIKVVERIATFYKRTAAYTKKLIEEDALRCIRSIQDSASRRTEHIRLAVILMMMKFVNTSSERFKEIMTMYSEQNMNDRVESFICEKYTKRDNNNGVYGSDMSWERAFTVARDKIEEWNKHHRIEDHIFEDELIWNLSEAKDIGSSEKKRDGIVSSIVLTKEKAERKKRPRKKISRNENRLINELTDVVKMLESIQI